jgi:hypothetical protein
MILTKEVEIKINQFNYHHYKRLGYDTNGKESIIISIDSIGKRTPFKIDVKCDLCGSEKNISFRKYTDNISKYKIYTCSNKCAMFKNEMTNIEKYGVKHQCKDKNIQDKIISTKIKKGIVSDKFEDYSNYRRVVNNLTNRVKKYLYENWDGIDYYDKDYIKENLSLNHNDVNYPTIDHKVSVFMGYKEGLLPSEIANIKNLCITKRKNNSSKGFKTEYVFKKQKKPVMTGFFLLLVGL